MLDKLADCLVQLMEFYVTITILCCLWEPSVQQFIRMMGSVWLISRVSLHRPRVSAYIILFEASLLSQSQHTAVINLLKQSLAAFRVTPGERVSNFTQI